MHKKVREKIQLIKGGLMVSLTTIMIRTRDLFEFCLVILLIVSAYLIGFGADIAPDNTKANRWFRAVWLLVICVACIILLLTLIIQTSSPV